MRTAKLNPTLFEKLTRDDRVTAILDEGRTELEDARAQADARRVVDVDRYGESAMRASVRRELGWLLNAVRLEAGQDLSAYPHVRTSVLNYGLPDLTGRPATDKAVQGRAREIEQAVRAFEPRLAADSVRVEGRPGVNLDNAVAFVIRGDVSAAVNAMPVQFFANVEVETGETVVQD